ncbi:MAG: hypothetical protein Q8L77_01545 [Nitrospirota bacterium]|nr:hypothetical protein [Nitrospirota bacterium]
MARQLQKRTKQRRWPERSLAKLEKEVFIGFYGIRKLLEARKLSDRLSKKCVAAEAFRYTGARQITIYNWNSKFADAYDFENSAKINMSLEFICNQVIHSYVFKEVFDEGGALAGIFISSDRKRNESLYYISLPELIKVFLSVGSDYPTHQRAIFDLKRGDYLIKNW